MNEASVRRGRIREVVAFGTRFVLAALSLLFATGCGDAPYSGTVVIHLDPRLEDGRSSAAVLSEVRNILYSQPFGPVTNPSGIWKLQGAKVLPAAADQGLRLTRRSPSKGPVGAVKIACKEPMKARRFHAFEIEMKTTSDLRTRLGWRREGEHHTTQNGVEQAVKGADGYQTVRFFPGLHPHWSGALQELWIAPEWDCVEGEKPMLSVRAVRILEYGFHYGHEPLEDGEGDGGLVEIGGETRRVWPSQFGVPLFARCTLPEQSRFIASVALSPDAGAEAACFTVQGRPSGGTWRTFAELNVPRGPGWRLFSADLSSLGGGEAELRLEARCDQEAVEIGKAPSWTHCFFGEPVVLDTAPREHPPSVILVTLDTTRADYVGDPEVTPNLVRLAETGIDFENAWSGCNATTPSHASILTGLRVYEHGALNNHVAFPTGNLSLAERFRRAGYHTAAAVSVDHVEAGVGFGQGFDRFRQADRPSRFNGRYTVECVERWFQEWRQAGRRPFFLWLHLFDPHTPYMPPEPFLNEFIRDRGDAVPPREEIPRSIPRIPPEDAVHMDWLDGVTNRDYVDFLYRVGVAYTDRLFGNLLDTLETHRADQDTILLVTADHGECLGEHDIWYSHAGLFRESLKVPLFLRIPGGPKGLRIDTPVSTLDIAPTLLNLAGIDRDHGLRGADLRDLAEGGGDPDRKLWFEYTRLEQIGVQDGRYHFVTTLGDGLAYSLRSLPEGEGMPFFGETVPLSSDMNYLFSIEVDPFMEQDLSKDFPKVVDAYLNLIRHWQAGLVRGRVIERELSEEEKERLRALGYGGY